MHIPVCLYLCYVVCEINDTVEIMFYNNDNYKNIFEININTKITKTSFATFIATEVLKEILCMNLIAGCIK